MHAATRTALSASAGGLLAGGLLALAASTSTPSDLYEKAVDQHVERAQAELLSSIEVWQDHSTWENAWRIRTAHYEVRTTESRAFGLALAEGLEVMLAHFKTLLAPDFEPQERFQVFVFPTLAEYNQFGDDFGAEHSSFYGSFYAGQSPERAVGTTVDANTTRLNMTVTHSALHQFLDQAFTAPPPLWATEGLASYFALFWDYRYGVSELERIRADEQLFVEIDELLTRDVSDYTDRTHSRLMELGMLFTYLLSYREDTRTTVAESGATVAPFGDYLRTLLTGGDTQGSVQRLLTAERAELEQALRTFDFGAN